MKLLLEEIDREIELDDASRSQLWENLKKALPTYKTFKRALNRAIHLYGLDSKMISMADARTAVCHWIEGLAGFRPGDNDEMNRVVDYEDGWEGNPISFLSKLHTEARHEVRVRGGENSKRVRSKYSAKPIKAGISAPGGQPLARISADQPSAHQVLTV